jgi:hypothetical protein
MRSSSAIWSKIMIRGLIALSAASLLAGCGVAETGAVAAAGGASEVEQAKQARQQLDQVKVDLAAADKAAADARAAAEAASQ